MHSGKRFKMRIISKKIKLYLEWTKKITHENIFKSFNTKKYIVSLASDKECLNWARDHETCDG